jgi:hypothetical protein
MTYTTRAWRRLELNLAQYLVLSLWDNGNHSGGYTSRLLEASDAIQEFRDMYYRPPVEPPLKG